MLNEFTLNCMEIIESLVDNDTYYINEVINNIYENYTRENMIEAIKHINTEYERLDLLQDTGYMIAYNILKKILLNIEEIKDVYNITDAIEYNNNSYLTICNKYHYDNKYFTISTINNKIYLSIMDNKFNVTWAIPYNDIWNSKESDIVIAKDKSNNIYKFQYINNKYELIDAYTIKFEQLIDNITYKTIFGTCKSNISKINVIKLKKVLT